MDKWNVSRNSDEEFLKTNFGNDIFSSSMRIARVEGLCLKADNIAHLIAAAPELYAACRDVVNAYEGRGDIHKAAQTCLEAMNKAKGFR